MAEADAAPPIVLPGRTRRIARKFTVYLPWGSSLRTDAPAYDWIRPRRITSLLWKSMQALAGLTAPRRRTR
jgi:hypothetical protein